MRKTEKKSPPALTICENLEQTIEQLEARIIQSINRLKSIMKQV